MSEPIKKAKSKKIRYDHLNFRLANWAEEDKIIDFVNDNFDWKLPLVNHRAFFEYYYCGKQLQFALAEQDGALVAVAGYILANESETPDLWVSVWVALKGAMGAGLELMDAIPKLTNARVVACNNIRENTCNFYRFLGWQAERLPHYYRLSKAASEGSYQLYSPLPLVAATTAKATDDDASTAAATEASTADFIATQAATRHTSPRLAVSGDLILQKVADAEMLCQLGLPVNNESQTPAKDLAYLQHRYFTYPYLSYDVWSVQEDGNLLAYCVTRTVQSYFEQADNIAQTSAIHAAPISTITEPTNATTAAHAQTISAPTIPVLRIVDFIGNAAVLPRIGKALDDRMEAEQAEYTDCYCAGISPEFFAAAGFYERFAPEDEANTTDCCDNETSEKQANLENNKTVENSAIDVHHVIIPNYLTSVLRANTEYFYFTNKADGFTLFKADGDQDRPNLP